MLIISEWLDGYNPGKFPIEAGLDRIAARPLRQSASSPTNAADKAQRGVHEMDTVLAPAFRHNWLTQAYVAKTYVIKFRVFSYPLRSDPKHSAEKKLGRQGEEQKRQKL